MGKRKQAGRGLATWLPELGACVLSLSHSTPETAPYTGQPGNEQWLVGDNYDPGQRQKEKVGRIKTNWASLPGFVRALGQAAWSAQARERESGSEEVRGRREQYSWNQPKKERVTEQELCCPHHTLPGTSQFASVPLLTPLQYTRHVTFHRYLPPRRKWPNKTKLKKPSKGPLLHHRATSSNACVYSHSPPVSPATAELRCTSSPWAGWGNVFRRWTEGVFLSLAAPVPLQSRRGLPDQVGSPTPGTTVCRE